MLKRKCNPSNNYFSKFICSLHTFFCITIVIIIITNLNCCYKLNIYIQYIYTNIYIQRNCSNMRKIVM